MLILLLTLSLHRSSRSFVYLLSIHAIADIRGTTKLKVSMGIRIADRGLQLMKTSRRSAKLFRVEYQVCNPIYVPLIGPKQEFYIVIFEFISKSLSKQL